MENTWISIIFTILFTLVTSGVTFYVTSIKNSVLFSQGLTNLKIKQDELLLKINELILTKDSINLKITSMDADIKHQSQKIDEHSNDSKELRDALYKINITLANVDATMKGFQDEFKNSKRS